MDATAVIIIYLSLKENVLMELVLSLMKERIQLGLNEEENEAHGLSVFEIICSLVLLGNVCTAIPMQSMFTVMRL